MPPAALLILTLLAATDPVPSATPPPVKLEFPLAGYRINALDSSTNEPFYFTMFLPVSSNSFFFKVDIQSLPETLQNYVKDEKSFLKQSGNTILLDRAPSPTEWLGEFTTTVHSGQKVHIYERALSANGRTDLIEATTPYALWPEVGAKFKASVDSFELSSEQVPGKVSFPQQGFRFSVLDGAAPVDAKQPLLMMFSSSLGTHDVTIEPYTKTLKDYQAERQPPLRTNPKDKFKILAETSPAENALVTEYAEEFPVDKNHPQGGQLLSYEKVFLAHGHLYRVWAYLYEADPKSTAQIKAWVDSLEVMPATAPAPAPAK
jgi:hypothetical protein